MIFIREDVLIKDLRRAVVTHFEPADPPEGFRLALVAEDGEEGPKTTTLEDNVKIGDAAPGERRDLRVQKVRAYPKKGGDGKARLCVKK